MRASFGVTSGLLWTNARVGADLAEGSFGGGASAAAGLGGYGDQSWSLSNPNIHTTQAGILFGGGASVVMGGSQTWVW